VAQVGIPAIGCTNCDRLIAAGDRIAIVAIGRYNEQTTFEAPRLVCDRCTEAVEGELKEREPDLYEDERDYQHPGGSGCCDHCDDLIKPDEELLPGWDMTLAEYHEAAEEAGLGAHADDEMACRFERCWFRDQILAAAGR
jgi:hypothetical protein